MDDRFLQLRIMLADERLRCWIEALKLLNGNTLALEAVYKRIGQEREGLWRLHTQLIEFLKAEAKKDRLIPDPSGDGRVK